MSRRVAWSRDALDDLKAQIAHIAADDPAAARRVAARLREAAAALGGLPGGRPGRVVGTFEKSVPGLRYVIAYALIGGQSADTVAILRVIHTARDWPPNQWPER